jgi:hypothetical protein
MHNGVQPTMCRELLIHEILQIVKSTITNNSPLLAAIRIATQLGHGLRPRR